jgi:hypothetical protein
MHRDSRAHNGLTPFQGEMRRRVWAVILQMDIVSSCELSLPATIHHHSCCSLPRNIFNHGFNKNTKELPPPRALSEATKIAYNIVKTRLTFELGKILAFAESEDDPTDDDISKYEQSLEEVQKIIPPHLYFSYTQEMTKVSAGQRLSLDRLYQACQCVLYRKSLSPAQRDPSRLRHRGLCIDASMARPAHQVTIYSEFTSSDPYCLEKRHIHELTAHDYFISSMAVALDL